MKALSSFFSVASAAFAVVPGITVLLSSIGVPPDTSKEFYGGVIEALGVLTLMLLFLNKDTIRQYSLTKVNRLAIAGIVVFIVSLFTYIFIYDSVVIAVPDSRPLFFPLWPQGELKEFTDQLGSKTELISQWGRDSVYKSIQSSSATTLLITKLLLLFVYQLLFVSLTCAFGIIALKSGKD